MRARFVTLNLWGDHAPLGARLAAAAAGLAALAPDVILLQEVRAGDGLPNTAAQLAARLGHGMQAHFRCATAGPAGTFGAGSTAGEEGLAILTPHAVFYVAAVELPDARPTERRILLSATVAVRGVAVHCHTTHLHWRPADGPARERQVVAVDEAARARGEAMSGSEARAVHVLGGDFNAPHDADEIRFLCGRHTLAGRRAVWQDAFARACPGAPGHTWSEANPMTAGLAWLERNRRIDFLFVSPEQPNGAGHVAHARVVLDQPDDAGTWPSDHFGVLADVELG